MQLEPGSKPYSTTISTNPKRRLWLGCISFAFSFSVIFAGLGHMTSQISGIQSFLKKGWKSVYVDLLEFRAQSKELSSPTAVPSPHHALNQLVAVPQQITPAVPIITEKEKLKKLERTDALTDPMNRISKDFQIPKGLEQRTQFWFDIYTLHDSQTHVIHHVRYPWVVYKIINTGPMIEGKKGPLWLRRQKAQDYVKSEQKRIRKALKRLAYKRSYKKLSAEERELYAILKQVPGKRSSVFKMAYSNVRSQLGQKDFFLSGLRNSSKYLPYMEEQFAEMGVPTELTRIPFVESSFNEKAVSKVGASGIWQIMPLTGKPYLRIDNYVDERNSPLKATRVAATIFKQYQRNLDSWPLTVTSYNHGIGNIKKAIRGARSRDLVQIIDRYHRGHFKFASANFFTCFLAALHAEKYHDVIFPKIARERLIEREVYTLTTNIRLSTLKKTLGLSSEEIASYNQDLKRSINKNVLLKKGYKLHLAPGMGEALMPKYGVSDKSPDRRAENDKTSKPKS